MTNNIVTAIDTAVDVCFTRANTSGWWKDFPDSEGPQRQWWIATKLALVHSEVSEALEGLRKSTHDDHLPQYKQFDVELADAVIRIFDLAGGLGVPLGEITAAKLAYNAERADHKPESRAAAGGKTF